MTFFPQNGSLSLQLIYLDSAGEMSTVRVSCSPHRPNRVARHVYDPIYDLWGFPDIPLEPYTPDKTTTVKPMTPKPIPTTYIPPTTSGTTASTEPPQYYEGYIELQFRISCYFVPAYYDPHSQQYKELATEITTEVISNLYCSSRIKTTLSLCLTFCMFWFFCS